VNSVIKHWRLFDSIAAEQIKQLDIAGICVRIEDDVSELEFPLAGKVQFVKNSDVYISTATEKQETLLRILFVDKVQFIGYNNDYKYR
jgi:DNA polymerase sigma